MNLLPPNLRLALLFAHIAWKHGDKILHADQPHRLAQDLGKALKKRREVLSDPYKGKFMTAYELMDTAGEVGVLSVAVALQLGIRRKGLSGLEVLEEIVKRVEERGQPESVKDIKDTLDWTRSVLDRPEMRDLREKTAEEISMPKTPQEAKEFIRQVAGRAQRAVAYASGFIKTAKKLGAEEAKDMRKPLGPNDLDF